MSRALHRLTAVAVRNLREAGRYPDGGGLYLQITPAGVRSWIFRYRIDGRERQMGLGPLAMVSLAQAREKARLARVQRHNGEDPLGGRKGRRPRIACPAAGGPTFQEAMAAYIETHKAGWRNAQHVQQWSSTLQTYAAPYFGSKPLAAITTADVLAALQPIWLTKTETANRVRGRIETILNWGAAQGYREGENPARWKGHIEMILPAKSKVAKVTHHAALDYRQIAAFMTQLSLEAGVGVQALRFTILTAARTGEVIGADWREIDFDNKVWIIPATRMKAGREHRVPLSGPAMEILAQRRQAWWDIEARRYRRKGAPQVAGPTGPVFCGRRAGKALSAASMLMVLQRMGWGELTCHGFRSTFRDWAAEETDVSTEVVEMALAHTIANKVEASYRRGDLQEKRRALMERWAEVCG
ncbi:MAG: tyrosine-type recombinase/integrase [Caulobacter sp.]